MSEYRLKLNSIFHVTNKLKESPVKKHLKRSLFIDSGEKVIHNMSFDPEWILRISIESCGNRVSRKASSLCMLYFKWTKKESIFNRSEEASV